MKQHWLERPGTIRLLWIIFLCILALTLLANLFTEVHGWFGLDGSFDLHRHDSGRQADRPFPAPKGQLL